MSDGELDITVEQTADGQFVGVVRDEHGVEQTVPRHKPRELARSRRGGITAWTHSSCPRYGGSYEAHGKFTRVGNNAAVHGQLLVYVGTVAAFCWK